MIHELCSGNKPHNSGVITSRPDSQKTGLGQFIPLRQSRNEKNKIGSSEKHYTEHLMGTWGSSVSIVFDYKLD
jgi:hypothetical protein